MDGAIRFTQRDALAAVLITGVNIVAGLIIGVFQHGLDLGTAAQTYTILTVGEGLVTAIPALLVSMSGGSITTRAASESNLGEEVADAAAGARRVRWPSPPALLGAARADSRSAEARRSSSSRRCSAPPRYATRERRRRGDARTPSRRPPTPRIAPAIASIR